MNFSFVQFAVASLYYRPDVSLVRGHGGGGKSYIDKDDIYLISLLITVNGVFIDHSLIISREVLILTIFNALNVCIS